MAFTGFSPQTYQFLIDLAFHNEKSYYAAHKEIYLEHVKQPFLALDQELAPFLLQLDNRLITGQPALSRIYRDTRFSKDKTPYRDHVWLTYKPKSFSNSEFFGIFFCIRPNDYEVGMGMYAPNTAFMQQFRAKILAAPSRFLRVVQDKKLRARFDIVSTNFAKVRHHHENDEIQRWLNMRAFYLIRTSDNLQETLNSNFANTLLDDFALLAPLYRFVHDLSVK